MNNSFVFVAVGDRHIDLTNTALDFLRRNSDNDILVVTARCQTTVAHNNVVKVDVPEQFTDHQASIYLKTSLHRLVNVSKHHWCYLDNDVIAISPRVDTIFDYKAGPVTFATDHTHLARFSKDAIHCGCTLPECDHLRQAVRDTFNVRISSPKWPHWNGGVFLFDERSTEFMELWHDYTLQVFKQPYWKIRDQGTLIAAAWRLGLQNQPTLPRDYNFIVDRMHSMTRAQRLQARPEEFHVNQEYSLEVPERRPAFLHFINGGVGCVGWKNWDDVVNLPG